LGGKMVIFERKLIKNLRFLVKSRKPGLKQSGFFLNPGFKNPD
jgi:hypothetical protein